MYSVYTGCGSYLVCWILVCQPERFFPSVIRKYDDEELEVLLLSWISNTDFCYPIKKVEAYLFYFDLLQQFRGNKLYYLVKLQRNKDNTMRRTFGDKGIKLVEFSRVGGPKVCHLTYF